MADRKLDIAFAGYDRTRALSDGTVKIEGVHASFHTARIVPEIFEAMIRRRAYDVSELGWTYYLRTFAEGESPFVAIPVFVNRAFRHSAIYVNKASGIARPEDLVRKRVGELALYGHDAGVVLKGILSDEYGIVHLIVDAGATMNLGEFGAGHMLVAARAGRGNDAGQTGPSPHTAAHLPVMGLQPFRVTYAWEPCSVW